MLLSELMKYLRHRILPAASCRLLCRAQSTLWKAHRKARRFSRRPSRKQGRFLPGSPFSDRADGGIKRRPAQSIFRSCRRWRQSLRQRYRTERAVTVRVAHRHAPRLAGAFFAVYAHAAADRDDSRFCARFFVALTAASHAAPLPTEPRSTAMPRFFKDAVCSVSSMRSKE